MFAALAIAAIVSLIFGVIVDEEMFRFANTVANFATVALVVWHQRHVRTKLEPEMQDVAAVVKRQLGERHPSPEDPGEGEYVTTDGYRGPERRRKRKVE